MFRQRLRIFFGKEGLLRFTSHHDLMRLWERALRRTGLPLRMTEGFNPHPQISIPAALALGISSREEIVEAELTEWVSPSRARALMEKELPAGIGVRGVESKGYDEKAEVEAAEFTIALGRVPDDFPARLAEFMASQEAWATREKKAGFKRVNIRPYVRAAELDGDALRLTLSLGPAGSARTEEVLEAVVGGPPSALAPISIARTRLFLKAHSAKGNGALNGEEDAGQHEPARRMPGGGR